MKFREIALTVLLSGAFVLLIRLSECSGDRAYVVRAHTVQVDSLDQIEIIRDSLVAPLLYTHISGLDNLRGRRAREVFISLLLPSVLLTKHSVDENRRRLNMLVKKDVWSSADSAFYEHLRARYRAADINSLLQRMIVLPNSIVLAQAAVESGWGKSRFFKEAHNVFGIWSFNMNEPRIRAGKTRKEKFIYLRAYDNMQASITDYFETLGTARAYKMLRLAALETSDPDALLPHLQNYSELRAHYTALLRKVINQNHLTHYDTYRIDPAYINIE